MTRILQVLIVALCAWDCLSTQWIVDKNLSLEANPIMFNVIECYGWAPTWLVKIGLGLIFAWALPTIIKSLWGRILMSFVYVCYILIAILHVVTIIMCK